jgi:hypothetical protein
MTIIRAIFDLTLAILSAMDSIWTFLSTPIIIGEVEFLGIVLLEGITFTPIALTGGVLIAILTVGLISLFLP